MKLLFKNYIYFYLPFFLMTGALMGQNIDRKNLDSLLTNGQNFTVFKLINALDTITVNKQDLALIYMYRAKCFSAENKNDQAFQSYLKAKRAYLAIDSLDKAMDINLDIAFFLSTEKNNRKKAESYVQDYLNYALNKKNDLNIATAYATWGTILMEEDPAMSLKYFKKSIHFSEKSKDDEQRQGLYLNLGVLYNEILQKPDSAIYYINKSIDFGKKIKNKNQLGISLINKASCYYYKKEYKKALELLNEANTIELTENSNNIKSYIYQFLSLNHYELGNYEEAYENLNTYLTFHEEFNFDQQNLKISEFNIKYETKEKEIENLTLKSKVQRSQIITYTTLGLLAVALIFTLLIYKNISKKKTIAEQKQLIQTQKLEKTLKEQELHDIDLMLKSQEIERQQIANELHDNLGSLLATLKLNFQNINRSQHPDDKNLFDKTDALLEETYQKVRNISHLKNMGVVGSDGLVVAVKKMAEKMSVINRLTVNVIPFGLNQRLSNTTEVTLFRIIQELCTNVIKHSQATEINIYLTQHSPDLLNIIIEDNGKGFDYKKVTNSDGIGLKTIEKKVEQMGGSFTVDSAPSKGTTIVIDLTL